MGKAFAYTRVSTPRQGERGVSLVEQRDAISRYADRHGMTIVRWFEEQESASKQGRPAFNQMLRLLRLNVARAVVIHKIDRSARNLEDWNDIGKLVDAGVDVHFATESIDLKTTAGRLSADIQAVVAAHYSRNLRDEVRKGLYGRLKQGFYPWSAPIGYLDQGSAKPKIPDPIRAPLIASAFHLYTSGEYSLPQLAAEMSRRGLRNKNGRTVSVNGIANILRNPFYVGLMRLRRIGQTYQGCHEPLVSTSIFKTAQLGLSGKRVDRTKHHIFLYSRIIRCASCHYSLIGERQKGHIYYRCHPRPFKTPAVCPVTSIREELIEECVLNALADISLSAQELGVAKQFIIERRKTLEKGAISQQTALKLQSDQLSARISKLTDLLLENAIDQAVFKSKQEALLLEQARVREAIKDAGQRRDSSLAGLEHTVELIQSALPLYKTGSVEMKRRLLKTVLSNLTVSEKKVEITLSLPFRLIAERTKNNSGRANRGTCRTWEQIIQELLTNPVELTA